MTKQIEHPFTGNGPYECEGSAWARFVRKYFAPQATTELGQRILGEFSFSADQCGLAHDEVVSFSPDGDVDEEELAEALAGRWEYNTTIFLEKLVADGIIPEGNYYIEQL